MYSQVSVRIASHDMKIKSNTADYKEIMIYVRLITRNNMVSNHVQSNMEDRERNFKRIKFLWLSKEQNQQSQYQLLDKFL